ncbi:Olfactory receptor 8D2 [Sciurus carolinensis]|uniref:Olfactory receptor 8D2 n=1 Tax=Sciurus carolinensis TaxID=30640 RepID=A0AA41MBL6_SCICA|nr:olfactory receptor 8D2-like [Sciurus carolinensis]MBZ3868899.1 Olfactory receptor 8D2 [Sciurus carolinensis]
MGTGNHSSATVFVLQGLTDLPSLQLPLFFLFLLIYVVSMLGNLGLVILIRISSQLHTPMYYFLSNLSFIDLCYSSVIIPKMLVNFVSERNFTSFPECMVQLFVFCFFGIDDSYMLTAMAYDRYVAICNPLLYSVTMSHRVCLLLVTSVYSMGAFGALVHTSYISSCSFCGTNVIPHYFCDILPLLSISCSRDYIRELLVMVLVTFNVFACALAILISYAFILSSILRIHSAEGKFKAFSTCSSHLAAVGIFYGSIIFMYFKPASSDPTQEKVASVFYTTVIPMLNPLIYSLRNKDVKEALKKVLNGECSPDLCRK